MQCEHVYVDKIVEDENISQYSELLRKVIFTRFAGQLSRVYSSIEMDSFLEMASIVSSAEAEKWLVQASNPHAAEYGAVHAKIDHQNRGIHFSVGDFHSNSLRNQLQTLGIALTVATSKLFPEQDLVDEQEWKSRVFTNVAARLEEDHKKVAKISTKNHKIKPNLMFFVWFSGFDVVSKIGILSQASYRTS